MSWLGNQIDSVLLFDLDQGETSRRGPHSLSRCIDPFKHDAAEPLYEVNRGSSSRRFDRDGGPLHIDHRRARFAVAPVAVKGKRRVVMSTMAHCAFT